MMTTSKKQIQWKYETDLLTGDVVLDITASGRYWRTSTLNSVDLLMQSPAGYVLHSLTAESEPDEYLLLEALPALLKGVKRIISFNGTAFDLPFLRNKCKAYDLPDPFAGMEALDLFIALKKTASLFALPSERLSAYASFIGRDDPSRTDAEITAAILPLLRYRQFLTEADFALISVEAKDESIIFTMQYQNGGFPREISSHDACFHIRFRENGIVLVLARTDGGRLRYYHTDIKNYMYLPQEGYAIHKSTAAFVDKSRRTKAVRENCFHYVSHPEQLLADREEAQKYLRSVLTYLASR